MVIKKKKIILTAILILILVFIGITVSKNRQFIGLILLPNQKYEPTNIPADTTDLFEFDGYIKNDLVHIYVQGGPNWELFERKLNPFNWIADNGTSIRVYPYQSQMLNYSILAAKPTLTEEQAQQEIMISAEILFRTIEYFKSRKKKVYVFCISHGSQIGLEMLRRFPNKSDKLILTMIRLDMDDEAYNLSYGGKIPYYDDNQELTGRYLLPAFLRFSRLNNRANNMIMMMKAGKNKYTKLLQEIDMTNVIFAFGKNDNKVGRPNKYELDFLRNKGVSIIELESGHDDIGNSDYINQINQLLQDN